MKIKEMGRNIVQSAIARNPFFTFASLQRYFPHLSSIREFIDSPVYLGGLEISIQGREYAQGEGRSVKLAAVLGLLSQIEKEIRENITEFEGTHEFRFDWIHEVFTDKLLKFDASNPRAAEDAQFAFFVSKKIGLHSTQSMAQVKKKPLCICWIARCKKSILIMRKFSCFGMKAILPSIALRMGRLSSLILCCSCVKKVVNPFSISFLSSPKGKLSYRVRSLERDLSEGNHGGNRIQNRELGWKEISVGGGSFLQ